MASVAGDAERLAVAAAAETAGKWAAELRDQACRRLEERDIKPLIPPKANRLIKRKTDFPLYRERNLVERFFNKLKQYRAVATRYRKLKNTFIGAIHLTASVILLK